MPGLNALLGWMQPYAMQAIRIVAILAFALIASRLSNSFLKRFRGRALARMMAHAGPPAPAAEIQKRANTINEIFRKTLTAVIWAVAVMMALRIAGFDIAPLIAGAGVAGLAIGFGAQSIVRDLISGVFILLENRIRIDDVVLINGTMGRVEEINLRTIVLRSHDGTAHIFRNGAVNTLSNLTWEYSYAVVAVRIARKDDPDHVAEALCTIGNRLRVEEPWGSAIQGPVEVDGVEQLTDFGYVIQVRVRTLPMQQFAVVREFNRRILKEFPGLGFELK